MSMEIIAWVGFTQGLFASIMMLSKTVKTLSDRVLAGWLTLLAIEFLTCALDFRIFGYPLLSSSFLLFNPAIYIYIQSLIRKNFKLKWVYLLHLLPFLFFEITAYITQEPFSFENFFHPDSSLFYRVAFSLATIISWLVYLPLSIRLLHRYRMMLQDETASLEKGQTLNWLYFVSIFYFIYSLVAGVLGIVFVLLETEPIAITYYNYFFMLLLVYIISFYGIYQTRLKLQTETRPSVKNESYKNSLLTDETKSEIRKKIEAYFKQEKAYLNPDLNMDLLSEKIGYPKYQITEVLNTEIGMNFFRYVNSHRIEAVKQELLKPHLKYSIEAIGYDCGFNSKSSFYTVFKKITGYTPISFRKEHLK